MIYFPTWMQILGYLYDNREKQIYQITISKRLNVTYSHVVKIVMILIKLNVCVKVKIGRRAYIKLTDEGFRYGANASTLLNKFGYNSRLL